MYLPGIYIAWGFGIGLFLFFFGIGVKYIFSEFFGYDEIKGSPADETDEF